MSYNIKDLILVFPYYSGQLHVNVNFYIFNEIL